MIAADMFNGSLAQLAGFRNMTGATFPLLRDGSVSAGGNLYNLYGDRDNYVVINKQGIVRYNANLLYAYEHRYHLDELRTVIDSLVTIPTGVEDPRPRSFALRCDPNPFRAVTTIELTRPQAASTPYRVTVHDLSGRLVATLLDGEAGAGAIRLVWDGRAASGGVAPAGLYLVHARIGSVELTRRVVRLR